MSVAAAFGLLSLLICLGLLLGRGLFWWPRLPNSPVLLLGTVVGMALSYLVPPMLLIGGGNATWFGAAAWAVMTIAYVPMVRFYRVSPGWAILLLVTALIYLGATIASAWRHYRGRGGSWKGRVEWRNAR